MSGSTNMPKMTLILKYYFYFTLQDHVTREYETICKQNEEASVQKCLQIINSLYASVSDKIKCGEFALPGGYEAYKKEMNGLEMQYMQTPRKGIMVSTYMYN